MSKYWLDQAVAEITDHYPEGEIIVSSGISPSASYHIGHFPEILIADALKWGLKQSGRQAKHIHVVDNFDPLRKRYEFLPDWLEAHVGQPICLVPAPDKSDQSYADYFYREFERYAREMGIYPDQVVKSYEDLYQTGKMADKFEAVLENLDIVRDIFDRVAHRSLPPDWTPIQVLNSDDTFTNASPDSLDRQARTIAGQSYEDGHAKLNWRLDWPARWAALGVMVEPFSAHEHGAAGGSYDTGKQFAREIFNSNPPLPGAQYGNIHLVGDNKKMSSSQGNVVTPAEALNIMPPEVLRYFVVKSRPGKTLVFDPGLGLYNLIDEFSQIEEDKDHQFREAYEFAVALHASQQRTISTVPFKHLVSVYQAAQGDTGRVKDLLRRTGYEMAVTRQWPVIERELTFVSNWLEQYAPEEIKFSIQSQLPEVELTKKQTKFLSCLADALAAAGQVDGQWVHEKIYNLKEELELDARTAFIAIYRVVLGQDWGPKAGWFLADLDRDWLIQRLRLKR